MGSLFRALRRAEGETGNLAAIAYGGGIVLATTLTVLAMIQFAAADSVGDVGPQVTQTLNVLNSEAHFGVNVGLAVLLLAAGATTLRTGVLFAWLGWAAVVIGIISATPAALFGLLAWLLWTPALPAGRSSGDGRWPTRRELVESCLPYEDARAGSGLNDAAKSSRFCS